jgi:hypothetical protein
MIIPSSSMGVFASSKPKIVVSGGGGGDVTPNAVNWADIYLLDGLVYFYSERQITGIDSSITLKVQYTPLFSATLYYYVSNTSGAIVSGDNSLLADPVSSSMTAISNNGTFTVSNNQYVTFGVIPACGDVFTVTVKNQSDGDVTLDTFVASQEGEC